MLTASSSPLGGGRALILFVAVTVAACADAKVTAPASVCVPPDQTTTVRLEVKHKETLTALIVRVAPGSPTDIAGWRAPVLVGGTNPGKAGTAQYDLAVSGRKPGMTALQIEAQAEYDSEVDIALATIAVSVDASCPQAQPTPDAGAVDGTSQPTPDAGAVDGTSQPTPDAAVADAPPAGLSDATPGDASSG